MTRISVVIPVYNAEATLAECLTRVFQSTFESFEVVLVDDGSTDRSRAIAQTFPVRIVPTPGRVGPGVARNIGARAAVGEILFFIDSDVMLRPDSLAGLAEAFEDRTVDALCGVQSAEMRHNDLVSQYKNLWMRWTYLRHTGSVPLFYTTAAAIRRDAFLRAGGFDEGYATPNVEDTAFGQKLARLGLSVRVHPGLEVEHVKRYSLLSLLRTDFMRAVSLTRLKLRHPTDLADNNTSVPTTYIASVGVLGLAVLASLVGLVLGAGTPAWVATGAFAALAIALNGEFLSVIRASEGWGRTLCALPVLVLELLVVGVGTGVGLVTYPLGARY
ncbi:MAG TPA: glycosyltransferase family 2 protein [Candidatus Limnocylindria bacterium]|nr:glycosyltransferase family 2 protein [Candidatus Limnocylindria bacterium]